MAPKGAIFLDTTTPDAEGGIFGRLATVMGCAARAGPPAMSDFSPIVPKCFT